MRFDELRIEIFPSPVLPADFANDVREIYWDPNATSKYNQKQGAYIESEPGKRYKVGEIPAGDPKVPAH